MGRLSSNGGFRLYIDHKRACLESLSRRRRRGYKYFLPVGSRFEILAGGWDENWIKYTQEEEEFLGRGDSTD